MPVLQNFSLFNLAPVRLTSIKPYNSAVDVIGSAFGYRITDAQVNPDLVTSKGCRKLNLTLWHQGIIGWESVCPPGVGESRPKGLLR